MGSIDLADINNSSNAQSLLMIDNFDSFTYILVDYFRVLGAKVDVFRNNEIELESIEKERYDAIVVSPGPKTPDDAGISISAILEFGNRIPILGVCLGHQAIGRAFGGKITHADKIMHGKTSLIYHEKTGLFDGVRSPFSATRYHSLVIDPGSVSTEMTIDARTEEGVIMAVSHKILPIYGVQFHPESVLTDCGMKILANFLDLARDWNFKYIS